MIKNKFLRILIVAANLIIAPIALLVMCITGLICCIVFSMQHKSKLNLYDYFKEFFMGCIISLHDNVKFLKDGNLEHFTFLILRE